MSTEDKRFIPVVVVDDLREFSDEIGATHCKTLVAAFDVLSTSRIGQLWLDHDLGQDEKTKQPISILPLINRIEAASHAGTPFSIEEVIIHTSNPVGASAMEQALRPWYKTSRVDARRYNLVERP